MEVDDQGPASDGYCLRCELHGHLEDVRGLCISEVGLVTSSRDKTIKLWVEDSPASFQVIQTLVGHTSYVGPVIYLSPGASPDYPQGVLVSGSRDTHVIVWDPISAVALVTLEGHQYQVTALGALPTGEIVSGSLDKSLRIWRGGKCVRVLEGHVGPVLSLVVVPETGDIFSGSGDATIRRWNGQGTCTATLTGHTDTVRGLCLLPGIGLVSASHDLTLRVWGPTGETLAELVGHTAIIYACAALENGLIASGSEDNTARVWRANGECLQVIEHPSNIWDLRFFPDGDLVTACADSVARVFTSAAARRAPAEAVASFQKLVADNKAAQARKDAGDSAASAALLEGQLPPGLKVEEAHVLAQPGSKDGDTKCVRENGAITAYAWDAGSFKWEKIGEVVAGPGHGSAAGRAIAGDTVAAAKKWHQGREWDYVFDVDVSENSPPLKLALDAHENPYIVADRFLEANELPPGYKDQIVKFIENSTGQTPKVDTSSMPVTGGFCDPFTGGGSAGTSGQQGYASQPRPPVPPQPFSATGGGVDPFTGGSTGSSTSGRPGSAAARAGGEQLLHAMAPAYLAFDNVPNSEALSRKLREFNSMLSDSGSGCALPVELLAPEGQLHRTLQKLPAAAAGSASGAVFVGEDLDLVRALLQWPAAQLFPALDLARIVALDSGGAALLAALAGSLDNPLPGTLSGALIAAARSEPQIVANQQLGLRLASNCFKHAPLREWVLTQQVGLLDQFAGCCGTASKAVRISLATLLGNFATAHHKGHTRDTDAKMQVLSALVELLGSAPLLEDEDSAFRSLVAVATLVHNDAEMAALARDLGINAPVAAINAAPGASNWLLQGAVDVVTALAKHPRKG